VTLGPVHPIEEESFRRLAERVDLSALPAGDREVVARVVHATADLSFAASMRLSPGAVQAGVEALRRGAPVVADVEMVRAGLPGVTACCHLAEARQAGAGGDLTLSALAMRLAAKAHPDGAVFAVGCAPTALEQLLDLVEGGSVRPALVVGVPVGFVGASEAKGRLVATEGLEFVSNVGERGGSAVAAAVVNALWRMAR